MASRAQRRRNERVGGGHERLIHRFFQIVVGAVGKDPVTGHEDPPAARRFTADVNIHGCVEPETPQ